MFYIGLVLACVEVWSIKQETDDRKYVDLKLL